MHGEVTIVDVEVRQVPGTGRYREYDLQHQRWSSFMSWEELQESIRRRKQNGTELSMSLAGRD